jgi:hypothetical protein
VLAPEQRLALACRGSVAVWARERCGVDLLPFQRRITCAPPGARVHCKVHRQGGKTEVGSLVVAHGMVHEEGSTSLFLAPTQRQSAEAIRRTRRHLLQAGAKLKVDNAFSLEVTGGGRVLSLPGSDDAAVRGITVDGVAVVDEASRVPDQLFKAVTPMLARHSEGPAAVHQHALDPLGLVLGAGRAAGPGLDLRRGERRGHEGHPRGVPRGRAPGLG